LSTVDQSSVFVVVVGRNLHDGWRGKLRGMDAPVFLYIYIYIYIIHTYIYHAYMYAAAWNEVFDLQLANAAINLQNLKKVCLHRTQQQ